MDYSLSDKDISDLLGGRVKILTHDKIKRYNDIENLLGKYNKCIILYRNTYNYGHWCCIFKNSYGINFFDSYGNKPDSILKFLPNNILKSLQQDHDNLIKLMYNSRYNIYFNQYKLQKLAPDINTCGKWCVFRLLCSELNENEFKNLFNRSKFSKDELINEIINFI